MLYHFDGRLGGLGMVEGASAGNGGKESPSRWRSTEKNRGASGLECQRHLRSGTRPLDAAGNYHIAGDHIDGIPRVGVN